MRSSLRERRSGGISLIGESYEEIRGYSGSQELNGNVPRPSALGDRSAANDSLTYAAAGVSVDNGNALVDAIKPIVKATRRPGADGEIGGFGGAFDLKSAGFRDPVLVSGTDGVGTKLRVALDCGIHTSVGEHVIGISLAFGAGSDRVDLCRYRPRRHVRQRSHRPRRRALVLFGLLCMLQVGRSCRCRCHYGYRRGLSPSWVCADRWRDRRDAWNVPWR